MSAHVLVSDPGLTWLGSRVEGGGPCRLNAGGTVTFQTKGTSVIWVNALCLGQIISVTVDGGPITSTALPNTNTYQTIQIKNAIPPTGEHAILITSGAVVMIQGFVLDDGKVLTKKLVVQRGMTLAPGERFEFYVSNTTAVDFWYVANGCKFRVWADQRFVWPPIVSGQSKKTVPYPLWGLLPFPQMVSVGVESDSPAPMILARTALWAPKGLKPTTLTQDAWQAIPQLTSFGDSISYGQGSLNGYDGYAYRLAMKKGWRLNNASLGGQNAHCYGENHAVWAIWGQHPAHIVVAFGANDIIPGKGYDACDDPDPDTYKTAIANIIDVLLDHLPASSVHVSGILPIASIDEDKRVTWNAAAQEAAVSRAVQFFIPDTGLDGTDFPDGLHPDSGGHEKIASNWAAALS
jgi:lysophospholipase L1-like esterase